MANIFSQQDNTSEQELLNNYDQRRQQGFLGNVMSGKVDASQIGGMSNENMGGFDKFVAKAALNKGSFYGAGSTRRVRQMAAATGNEISRREARAIKHGVRAGIAYNEGNTNNNELSARRYQRAQDALLGMQGSYIGSYKDKDGNIVHQNSGLTLGGDYANGRVGWQGEDAQYGAQDTLINNGAQTLNQYKAEQSKVDGMQQVQDNIYRNWILNQKVAADTLPSNIPEYDPKDPQSKQKRLIGLTDAFYKEPNPFKRQKLLQEINKLTGSKHKISEDEFWNWSRNQKDFQEKLNTESEATFNSNFKFDPALNQWVPKTASQESYTPSVGQIDYYKPGGNINYMQQGGQVNQRRLLGAIAKLALVQSKNDPKKAQALIPQIMQGLQKKDQKIAQAVQQVMQQSDQKELEQLGQQLEQQMQQSQSPMARFGAKLDYIKSLKNECPNGYSVHYFSKGGGISKTCVPCMEKAKAALAEKGCKATKKSSCKKKLQDGGTAPESSNAPTSQDINTFYKNLAKELQQQFLQKQFTPVPSALIPQPDFTPTDTIKLPKTSYLDTQDRIFIPSGLNERRKLKTLKTNRDRQSEIEGRLTNMMANAIKQSRQ